MSDRNMDVEGVQAAIPLHFAKHTQGTCCHQACDLYVGYTPHPSYPLRLSARHTKSLEAICDPDSFTHRFLEVTSAIDTQLHFSNLFQTGKNATNALDLTIGVWTRFRKLRHSDSWSNLILKTVEEILYTISTRSNLL